ncbi:hypothetical protein WN944_026473 [Citrus x changshan-huyou]|uniref:Uncharacterized protein n=1 Tax=Citrus x changshan-huyou TaxID=2935761 RepID=A0AAP0QHN4_9ROSI
MGISQRAVDRRLQSLVTDRPVPDFNSWFLSLLFFSRVTHGLSNSSPTSHHLSPLGFSRVTHRSESSSIAAINHEDRSISVSKKSLPFMTIIMMTTIMMTTMIIEDVTVVMMMKMM